MKKDRLFPYLRFGRITLMLVFALLMAATSWAETTPVKYLDEKGVQQTVTNYTVLTSSTNVSNLPGGWYVVQGEVKYTSQVKFSGDAHLILADDAKMEIKSESKYGIYASNNLTIYGQNGQSGILNDTANGTNGIGIYSYSGDITINGGKVTATGNNSGIYASKGVTINGGKVTATGNNCGINSNRVTISGGSVEATGSNAYGIYGSTNGVTISGGTVEATSTNGSGIYGSTNGVTISGGSVTATGSYGIHSYDEVTISGGSVTATGSNRGIYSWNGNVTINGGKVTATGNNCGIYGSKGVTISGGTVEATSSSGYGIGSNSGDITLGRTNSTDNIKASSYFSEKGSVSIAEGKSFKDENGNVYRGTLNAGQLSSLKGQKIEPFEGVSVSFVDNFSGASDVFAEIAVDGEDHVSAPSKHPFHSGYAFVGWFTATDGNTEFDFSAAITGKTTAYAHWTENTPVEYIDENGTPKSVTDFIVLTEYNKPNGNGVINLPEGWYVVQGAVKYTSEVMFEGDAHLILADDATIEIETGDEHGIYASNNLTIYGQSNQNGILKATATGHFGIYSKKNITINGGTVTATGEFYGIYGVNGFTINGGSVTASGYYGIYGSKGVTISGGKVTATGNNCGIGSEEGIITLGWTNSTDFIKANSYYSKNGVSIAEGKSFVDENGNEYRGTLTAGQLASFKGQKIEPFEGVSVSFVDNFSGASDVFAEIAVDGEDHVSAPSKHPFHSGYAFVGWFTATDGNTEFDFTATVTESTTAYAHWNKNTTSVKYIDENGKANSVTDYVLLTNDIYVEDLPGGWYVVQGEVKFTSKVVFEGDAHLILADDAKMEIESEDFGIEALNNLTIYGQNEQSGSLNATALAGIYSYSGDITIIGGTVTATGSYGIFNINGDITINGGTVEASGSYGIGSGGTVEIKDGSVTATGNLSGIYGNNVTISGGSVTTTGENGDGIESYNKVTISGGKVTASGSDRGIGSEEGIITLGWTNSTDFIKANSYYSKNGVSIAEGKSFKDENGKAYSGTLTGEQLSAIKGNKLVPCYAVTFDAQNGDDPIMHLTTFDENGVAHVKKPNDPIRSSFTFEGWFTAKDGGTEFDFSAAITGNTTAYAKWKDNALVEYIDEKGETKKTKNYILLTNDINVDNLPEGWYVVEGEVKYTNQVKFSGEAHLILADDATLEIETESKYGIYASKNLTIYGQSNQNGILNASGGIRSEQGNITISGGTVTATGNNIGISASNGVTISGGKVTASGSDRGIGSEEGIITLGWTNDTDHITASSYYSVNGSISIAEGKSFVDENGNEYSGTLTGEQLSAIKGNKLVPCYAVTFDAQNGDDPIMLPATFDENGDAHVAKPADPTRDGFSFEGWFTATDGNTEFDFSAAITGNTTAYAKWSVPYIDENGAPKSVTDFIVLTEDNKPNENGVINLDDGWYVVQGEVKYTSQVMFSGDAHLILADDATIEIETGDEHGIYASNNLTIYGQSNQNGILKATGNNYGIYGDNGFTINGGSVEATGDYGIIVFKGVTISGGSVTATGESEGICSYSGDITISGGSVTASGNNYGIYGDNGFTINGGSVTASGYYDGIYAYNGITLGWTNDTDHITASSYYSVNGSVSIAKDKSFKDEKGYVYSGKLNAGQLSSLNGQKLEPFEGVSVSFVDNFNGTPVVFAQIAIDENGHVSAPEDPTCDGYKFLGWYTTADGDTKFDFEAPITTDMIAYAKWEVAKYTITVVGEYLTVNKTEALEGETVTLTVDYDGDYIIMIGAKGMEFNLDDYAQLFNEQKSGNSISFDMPVADITLRLAEKVGVEIAENIPYIDENGKTNICEKAEVIQSDYVISRGGWYVVEGDVTANSIMIFSELENIHIILKDNAKLTLAGVEDEGVLMSALILGNLSIYAQSIGDNVGSFIAEGAFTAKNLIVNGGSIQAKAVGVKDLPSLKANMFTMNGGSVNANYADIRQFTINGGSVNANYAYIRQLTMNGGSLKALNYKYAFNIAAGTYIADEDGIVYSGTIDDVSDIAGKTLVPSSFKEKFLSDVNVAVADIPVQKYADGKPVCPSVVVTDGKDTLEAGTDYTVTCVNNTAVTSATLDEAAIAQITGKGNYAGEIQKRFFIWNNIRDYAAVQVFQDAGGNTHAEIDGAYDGTDAVAIDEYVENVAVKFNREFLKDTYSTMVLPFSVKTEKISGLNAVLYYNGIGKDANNNDAIRMKVLWAKDGVIKDDKGNSVSYKDTVMNANTPYLVLMGSETFEVDGPVTIVPTTDAVTKYDNLEWEFHGVWEFKKWEEGNKELGYAYGFAASAPKDSKIKVGDFVKIGEGTYIYPLRAYLVSSNIPDPVQGVRANGAYVKRPTVAQKELPELMSVIVDGLGDNGNGTTVIGKFNTRTGEFKMNYDRGKFDLKGRNVGNKANNARGAYYGKKTTARHPER